MFQFIMFQFIIYERRISKTIKIQCRAKCLLLFGIPYLVTFRAQIYIFQIDIIIANINNLRLGCAAAAATAATAAVLVARTFIIWAAHCMNPRQSRVQFRIFIHHLRKGLRRGFMLNIDF